MTVHIIFAVCLSAAGVLAQDCGKYDRAFIESTAEGVGKRLPPGTEMLIDVQNTASLAEYSSGTAKFGCHEFREYADSAQRWVYALAPSDILCELIVGHEFGHHLLAENVYRLNLTLEEVESELACDFIAGYLVGCRPGAEIRHSWQHGIETALRLFPHSGSHTYAERAHRAAAMVAGFEQAIRPPNDAFPRPPVDVDALIASALAYRPIPAKQKREPGSLAGGLSVLNAGLESLESAVRERSISGVLDACYLILGTSVEASVLESPLVHLGPGGQSAVAEVLVDVINLVESEVDGVWPVIHAKAMMVTSTAPQLYFAAMVRVASNKDESQVARGQAIQTLGLAGRVDEIATALGSRDLGRQPAVMATVELEASLQDNPKALEKRFGRALKSKTLSKPARDVIIRSTMRLRREKK